MNIDGATLIASIVLNLTGAGLVGQFLLQRDRNAQKAKLARLKGDLEREMRALQASLDRTVLVHRVQFETEFQAMKLIWAKVMTLRGYMAALRPDGGFAPANQTPEEELGALTERFRRFSSALQETKDAVYENEPFVVASVFHELFERLIPAAQAEYVSVRAHAKDCPLDWFEKGEENLGKLKASADQVSGLIRARIQELVVVEK